MRGEEVCERALKHGRHHSEDHLGVGDGRFQVEFHPHRGGPRDHSGGGDGAAGCDAVESCRKRRDLIDGDVMTAERELHCSSAPAVATSQNCDPSGHRVSSSQLLAGGQG